MGWRSGGGGEPGAPRRRSWRRVDAAAADSGVLPNLRVCGRGWSSPPRLLLNVLGPPSYACGFGYPRPIIWCMGFSQQKQSFGPFNYLLFIGPSTLHALHGPVSFLVHSDRFFSSLTQMHAVLVLSCSSKPVAPRTFVKQKQGARQERRISKWSQK